MQVREPAAMPVTLTTEQTAQLTEFARQLRSWNVRVNLVSRKSAAELESRHIAHSLVLASKSFTPGTTVVDWGTGGGLPGIPLAIMNPDVTFVLVDSIKKKVKATAAMIEALGLKNASAVATRAEQWDGKAHYSVSRATVDLMTLWNWHKRVAEQVVVGPDDWQPGVICLKGGDLSAEVGMLERRHPGVSMTLTSVDDLLPGPEWAEKWIVCLRS